ncbi:Aste57867_21734 [Aphanomyces stellatus]|uniref:Aste57867_21734 protein n=1 Tax=Aphanomyces stellatus TaxID=120398 RepID=A0A485LIB9_9STRA|nr:hypothetical protein As57867_021665 [Aphanomyces stellatus]VFT98403.1 Aste57867_21734 [Aphanomyces stellatus]
MRGGCGVAVLLCLAWTCASFDCPYIHWTAQAIQTYNYDTKAFEIVDANCNILPPATKFQAVGDISLFNGSLLNYTNRPELIDIAHATFPDTAVYIDLYNIGVSSLENKGLVWRAGLQKLRLTNMSIYALPSTLPEKIHLELNNVKVANKSSFSLIKPYDIDISFMEDIAFENTDWSGLYNLKIKSSSVKSISNVLLPNLSQLVLIDTSVASISNSELPGPFGRFALENAEISNWSMENSTFTALNAPNVADGNVWTLNNNSAARYEATACTKQGGSVQYLWKQVSQTRYKVCVVPPSTPTPSTSLPPASSIITSSPMNVGVIAVVCVIAVVVTVGVVCWRKIFFSHKSGYEQTQTPVTHFSASDENSLNIHDLAMLRLDAKSVVLTSILGSGAFADVWLGSHCGTNVAVKTLHARKLSIVQVQSFVDEIKLMGQFDSPHVVKLIGACWTRPADIKCVMELMDGGDLRDYLASHDHEKFPWPDKFLHIHSIVEGLVYLHSMDIIHRDLKSRNILLDSTKGTKLTDFGISKEDVCQMMTMGVGTLRWMAPEVIQAQNYTVAADIYSFGMVLSEFDSHEIPYQGLKNPINGQLASDLVISNQVATGALRPAFSDTMPVWLRSMALQCLAQIPEDRPTAVQLAFSFQTELYRLSSELYTL